MAIQFEIDINPFQEILGKKINIYFNENGDPGGPIVGDDNNFHIYIYYSPTLNNGLVPPPDVAASRLLFGHRWNHEKFSFAPFNVHNDPTKIMIDEVGNPIGEFITPNNFYIYHQLRYLQKGKPDYLVMMQILSNICKTLKGTGPVTNPLAFEMGLKLAPYEAKLKKKIEIHTIPKSNEYTNHAPIIDDKFHVWIFFSPVPGIEPQHDASQWLFNNKWSHGVVSFSPWNINKDPKLIMIDPDKNPIGEFVTPDNFYIYHKLHHIKYETAPDFKVLECILETLCYICEDEPVLATGTDG